MCRVHFCTYRHLIASKINAVLVKTAADRIGANYRPSTVRANQRSTTEGNAMDVRDREIRSDTSDFHKRG
jgi:hypothetical protein